MRLWVLYTVRHTGTAPSFGARVSMAFSDVMNHSQGFLQLMMTKNILSLQKMGEYMQRVKEWYNMSQPAIYLCINDMKQV